MSALAFLTLGTEIHTLASMRARHKGQVGRSAGFLRRFGLAQLSGLLFQFHN